MLGFCRDNGLSVAFHSTSTCSRSLGGQGWQLREPLLGVCGNSSDQSLEVACHVVRWCRRRTDRCQTGARQRNPSSVATTSSVRSYLGWCRSQNQVDSSRKAGQCHGAPHGSVLEDEQYLHQLDCSWISRAGSKNLQVGARREVPRRSRPPGRPRAPAAGNSS